MTPLVSGRVIGMRTLRSMRSRWAIIATLLVLVLGRVRHETRFECMTCGSMCERDCVGVYVLRWGICLACTAESVESSSVFTEILAPGGHTHRWVVVREGWYGLTSTEPRRRWHSANELAGALETAPRWRDRVRADLAGGRVSSPQLEQALGWNPGDERAGAEAERAAYEALLADLELRYGERPQVEPRPLR